MSEILHHEEDTRQEEMWKKPSSEVNGAKVWGDTPTNDIDTSDINKKEKKDIPVASIADMQMQKEKWDKNMHQLAQINPSVLAIQDHWPEAIAQAHSEVQKEWWPC